jgi:hypothetical protein
MKMPADVNSKVLEKTLCKRLPILSNHFADMRRGLDRAVGAYNKAVGSFEERVLVPAGRFKELGASTGDEIEILEGVDSSIRPVAEDSLTGVAELTDGKDKGQALNSREEQGVIADCAIERKEKIS